MSTFRRRLLTNQALRVAKGDLIYPGLVAAWSAEGKTNEDSDRNILKDLTGHGHDITLNNMAYAGMSGYGGHRNYAQGSENEVKITSVENKLNAVIKLGYKVTGLKKGDIITMSVDYEAYNINFDSNSSINIQFGKYYSYSGFNQAIISNGKIHLKRVLTLNNHYNSSDPTTEEDDGAPNVRFDYITFNEGGYFLVKNFTVVKGGEEVEWFKDYQYPNALVFDGVDDYGICKNMPIQNDFTLIAKRQFISKISDEPCFISKAKNVGEGAFICELTNQSNFESSRTIVYSYNHSNSVNYVNNNIIYLTPLNYTNQTLNKGKKQDTNMLCIGCIRDGTYNYNRAWNGAFYSAYLFNKSLEESEIKSFIRKYIDPEYLLPSEIPTPDCYYDFSLGSNEDENRETIVDQSGNDNDAKAYNFAWSGMSGYGGYGTDFNSWNNTTGGECQVINGTKIIWSRISKEGWGFCKNLNTQESYKFKIKGDNSFMIKYDAKYIKEGESSQTTKNIITEVINENQETEIILPVFDSYPEGATISPNLLYFSTTSEIPTTIELIPEYPGALVLDGTDDYIALESFDSGFKTVFMLCRPFSKNTVLYDQRYGQIGTSRDDFAIFLDSANQTAYNSRNVNGTYINGKYNTTIKTLDLIDKKHLIHIKSKLTKETTIPVIGGSYYKNNYFSNMAIYKFLGFKEELTDDQIQYVIKKYNLLDGVDEIEETT